jgi:hypothetical protein
MATMRNLDIDQDFPVAGQDNESQGFRDNFSAIKDSLTYLDEQLFKTGGLTETTVKLGERNEFDINASLETVKLLGTSEATVKSGQAIVLTSGQELNYSAGSYHSILLTSSTSLDVIGFPMPDGTEDGRFAKLRLDATLSTFNVTTAGSFVVGHVYTIFALGNTNFTAIGATANTVGITFKATGVGSGTGTAKEAKTLSFTNSVAGGTIKYEGNWPTTLYVTSETNPVVVEFWSYDGGEVVYAQYLGQFGQTVRDTAVVNLTVTGTSTLGDAVTDRIIFNGIPKLPLVDGVTLSGLTPEVGMMIFNTTTKRVQAYVPDTGLAQGNNASNTAGWINIS